MINVFIPDEIPLMMFSKKFPVEEATLVLIIEEVDITPFTFEVKVFNEEDKVLVVVVPITFPFSSTASNVLFSPVSVVLADVN